MRSRVTVLGHPLHPMLVMFPVALLPLLVVLDAVAIYGGGSAGVWTAGFVAAAVGGVLTVVAIVPGIVDLAAIPDGTKAHRTAFRHFVVGMLILALYGAGAYLRWPMDAAPAQPFWVLGLDVIGTLAVTVQGWLGAELVYRHHIGVRGPGEGAEPTPLKDGPGLHVPPPERTKRGEPR